MSDNNHSYKNGFRCSKCPQNSGDLGCPCWVEFVWTNNETGETKVEKGCYFQIVPKLLLHVAKCANQATEQSSKVNNNLMNGLVDIGNVMLQEFKAGSISLEEANDGSSE